MPRRCWGIPLLTRAFTWLHLVTLPVFHLTNILSQVLHRSSSGLRASSLSFSSSSSLISVTSVLKLVLLICIQVCNGGFKLKGNVTFQSLVYFYSRRSPSRSSSPGNIQRQFFFFCPWRSQCWSISSAPPFLLWQIHPFLHESWMGKLITE